ncbi:alpha,alpha-phosphotrehalase [Virgibacillus phasianinus]|uniref:Alpha,alpha-phosphotrehalase n=1 Tax=Virgibacillus phasianinus TaxID=2017483 RepID=A0A220TZV2_9BACI|nr:alpha,alpha-phosphotrehalase [Virgibacillus phasianinus]ASK61285.1 alpha,alpha-phosphotrehalase [Virgibacillus phasianinus]
MTEPWWKKSVVYQIYPKSFQDTTGNGVGDIQGIITRLDYLEKLGVDVIWLTPVYQSPQWDNGYDISDYFSIDERYGSMADFDQLLEETHRRGMRLIMDLVINHTSTANNWFVESAKSKDNEYRDFYIWKDAENGKEPSNWLSKFGGSAWKYDEKTDQYYLHLFDQTQADLNWENRVVRKKLYDMMHFWADKGIDGFRLDVINLISKDQQFPDDHDGDGRKHYTDGPRIHEYLHEMNQAVFSKHDMMTVGEMSSTTLDNCTLYTNPDRNELDMTFQFHHLKVDYPNGEKWTAAPFDFQALKQILSKWQQGMYKANGWNALFWCNHDQPRAVSRFGNDEVYRVESAKMLATTLHFMQGTPYIYQGEEIGMTNPNFQSIKDYRDVESLNAYESLKEKGISVDGILAILNQKSRDNSRTPMQWSQQKHAGFTFGTPWISVAENYQEINAEQALQDEESIFYHYQNLIKLRKELEVITYGDYQLLLENHPQVFVYTRIWKGQTLCVVNNFYEKDVTIELPYNTGSVLLSNYNDSGTSLNSLRLRPYESIVYDIK